MSTEPQSPAGTRAGGETVLPPQGRIIRPAAASSRLPLVVPTKQAQGVEGLGEQILEQARQRVRGLAELERDMEDRIRARRDELEGELARRRARVDEELTAQKLKAEGELKEKTHKLEKEGRAAGFREGFARGREEGYRLGLEEGRRDGEREGHEEASRRLDAELATAIQAVAAVADRLDEDSRRRQAESQEWLLQLALAIGKKLAQREVRLSGDVVLHTVEKAIELIFRRGTLVIQVNPEDTPLVERALASGPRWTEGFDRVEVRSVPEVGRGGCRLLSGAGFCDLTFETQLALIEEALRAALPDLTAEPAAPASHALRKEQQP